VTPGLRRLGDPRPVTARAGPDGAPVALGRARVDAVSEEWVVEDRWWTEAPLRRRYFELVLADGRNVVVFCDLEGEGRWYEQRA
jgi:hypothetical protein